MQTNPIILIQEPYLYKGKVRLALPNYKIFSHKLNSRAAIAIPQHFRFWHVSELSDRDTTTIILEENDNDKYLIVSGYMDITNPSVIPTTLDKIRIYSTKNRIPVLAGLDTNAHSTLWGCDSNNSRGDILEEWLFQGNFAVINKGNEKTFVTKNGSSIIDVTICTYELINKVSNWFVDTNFQFSDHRRIEFTLDFDFTIEVWSRCLRKGNWKKFQALLRQSLPRLQPPVNWTRDFLDEMVINLNLKIRQALDIACPLRKVNIKGPSNSWWSNDLEILQRTVRKRHRDWCRNRTEQNYAIFKRHRNEYIKAVKTAKKESWEKFCSSIVDVKSLSKLIKSMTNPKMGEIGMLKNSKGSTTNGAEVLKELMDCHFPNSLDTIPLGLNSDKRNKVSMSNNFIKEAKYLSFITKEKVKAAFKSFGSYKAAGPDGWKPIILQNLDDTIIEHIVSIYKASLALGYNPKAWCKSKVIFIPKGGKTYETAKSFRPISLTDFLFKGLERLVQWELNESFKIPNKLHNLQYAFAKDKSTDGAISKVVDKIEAGLLRNQFCLGIFCDISGAFDSIKIPSIIEGMKQKGVPPFLTNWFECCLENRQASATINNDSITRFLTQGVAQGGVGSPLAWNIGIDDILHKLNKPPFTLVGFADDLCLLVSGSDPNTLVELCQPVIDKITKLGSEKGLSFNEKKTQVVLFTLRKSKATKKVKVNNAPIEFSKEAKYLGMILDEKLSFSSHINQKVMKCKQHLFAIRNMVGQKWGTNAHLMRWAYTGIIRPKLTYGCHVWSHKITKTLEQKLARLNRLCCLNLAPVKRSTPTAGLEMIYNLLPLDLYVKRTASITFNRIRKQVNPVWDGIGTKTGKLGHLKGCEKDLSLLGLLDIPTDKITAIHSWTKHFEILDFEMYKNDSSEKISNMIYCYTDGSKVGEKSGFGFNIRRENKSRTDHWEYLGKWATVFQAEVTAITRVSQSLKKQYSSNIIIRSDSQAALLAIKSNQVESVVVKDCIVSLNNLAMQGNKIKLQWIKAHVGHLGNEAADKNAKRGAEEASSGPEPFLPVPQCHLKKILKSNFDALWQERWKKDPKFCEQTKLWYKKPSKIFLPFLKKESRIDVGKIVQFITGHCNLRKHQFRIGNQTNPNCSLCNTTSWETPWHLVTECQRLKSIREKYFHGLILHTFAWSPQIQVLQRI